MILLLISIAIVILILVVIAFKTSKLKKRPTDYRSIFILGIILLPGGFFILKIDPDIFVGMAFFILGVIYSLIGLFNKDKWKSNKIDLNKLTKQEIALRIWIIAILSILLIIGIIFCILLSRGIV